MRLRPYQHLMVAAIRTEWAAGRTRVLGVLPTGGGKTEVATAIMLDEASPTSRVLVVVERKTLCTMWRARLVRHGAERVGIVQAENTTDEGAPILVGTIQSLRARPTPRGVTLIVIDESHIWHAAHDDVLEGLTAARVLGLTATPLREGLGLRFESVVVGATIRELTQQRWLVPARYFAPQQGQIEQALAAVAIRAGDYAVNELSAAMRGKAILGDVVSEWQHRAEDRQSIAFCVDKEHARELASQFNVSGVAARVVLDDTDDDERAAIFAAFDVREVRVLCSVGVLSIGFDSPIASCAILARPTRSLSLYVQQGGRVLRPCAGKADALILDHAGNVLAHGMLEDFSPPEDLSTVDKHSDKKPRRERAELWVCRACAALNTFGVDYCAECGEPRFRRTQVVILDGELVSVELGPSEVPPAPTPADVRAFYLQALWHYRARDLTKPEGRAFYATKRRFRVHDDLAPRLIAWDWRYMEAQPPTTETARWLHADWQRERIAWRKSRA